MKGFFHARFFPQVPCILSSSLSEFSSYHEVPPDVSCPTMRLVHTSFTWLKCFPHETFQCRFFHMSLPCGFPSPGVVPCYKFPSHKFSALQDSPPLTLSNPVSSPPHPYKIHLIIFLWMWAGTAEGHPSHSHTPAQIHWEFLGRHKGQKDRPCRILGTSPVGAADTRSGF